MATIKPQQAEALLGKGLISNEFYDTLTANKGDKQASAIQETAKTAEQELKSNPIDQQAMDNEFESQIAAQKRDGTLLASTDASFQAPASSSASDIQPGAFNPPAPNPNDVSNGPAHNVSVGGFNVNDGAPQNGVPKAEPVPEQYAMRNAPGVEASRVAAGAPNSDAALAAATAPAPEPGATVMPEQTIKPAAAGAGKAGATGSLLPKSEQQAYNNTMERAAAETGLQTRQNATDIAQADANAATWQQGQDAYKVAHEAAEADRIKHYDQSIADTAALDKLNDENRQANMIDPERHWSHGLFGDNKTVNKITAGLGILLGGFGQGLQQAGGAKGARNAGVDALEQTIDRDLAAQKADAETREGHFRNKSNLVKQKRELYKDKELGDAAAAEQIWTDVGRQIQVTAAKSNSETVKVNADKAMVGIADKVGQAQVAKQARIEQIARQNANAAYARSIGGQYDAFIKHNPNHPLAQVPREAGIAAFKSGQAPNANIAYQQALKVDPDKANKKDPKVQSAEVVLDAVDQLEKLHAKTDIWTAEEVSKAQEYQETIRNNESVMQGQGQRDQNATKRETPLGERGTRSKVSLASLRVIKDKARRIAGSAPQTKIEEH